MNTKESAYGKGFVIRMAILLGLLVLVVGGFFYDSNVLLPNAQKKIDEVLEKTRARTDDGQGIHRNTILETVGNSANVASRTYDKYKVDTFTFKRILPFMEGYTVEVAYQDELVVWAETEISDKTLDGIAPKTFSDSYADKMPASMGMGGSSGADARSGGGSRRGEGRPRGQLKDDDKGEKKADDADEKKEEAKEEKKEESKDEDDDQ